MKKRFPIIAFTFLFCLVFLFGCFKSETEKGGSKFSYLCDVCEFSEEYAVSVLSSAESVVMGGVEYCGGVILGNVEKRNENCKVTFNFKDENISNVSFYIGSTHYSGAYINNFETVYVAVDGERVLEQRVYNHSLPTYHEVSVSGAESISFEMESEDIITAIGELKAWAGEVEAQSKNETSEEPYPEKLFYDLKPYYLWGEESMVLAYSQNGDTIEFAGEEYTDAVEVHLQQTGEWANEYFIYFNLDEKYSKLSFKTGLSKIGEVNTEMVEKAVISVYLDDVLLFSQSLEDFDVKNFDVSVVGTRKLTFGFCGVAGELNAKVALVGAFVEKTK